ncbi:MAG: hypothetical protein AAF321_01825 [Pseudomonadota bacterium]
MNTQTHLLAAAAVLARPGRPWRNAAVLAGALLPDLSIYALFVWSRAAGIPQETVWGELYWSQPWQAWSALSNSAPIWALLALCAWLAMRAERTLSPATFVTVALSAALLVAALQTRESLLGVAFIVAIGAAAFFLPARPRLASALLVMGLAALLHLALDAPVHVDDAHRHLWPLGDWRFRSPVSYWDPDHHGRLASAVEALLGLALCVVVWRRFRSWWVRAALLVCAAAYVLVPAYWILFSGLA